MGLIHRSIDILKDGCGLAPRGLDSGIPELLAFYSASWL